MIRNAIAVAIVLLFGLSVHAQSTVCNYGYRKRITFDPTKVSGTSDLTDFTALINITSDNDLRTTGNGGHVANSNGYDIIFTSSDGVTVLNHQLEKYTATTGEVIAHVRIPSLSTSLNTIIYMYYGNSGITTDPSSTSAFNSNYEGVWHLNNNNFNDATSNANNATNSGSSNLASAKIGGGRSFPGTGTNYLQLGFTGMNSGSGNGSVEFWGLRTGTVASTYFFGHSSLQNGSYASRIQLYQGDNTGTLYLGIGGNHSANTTLQAMTSNTWYHIALAWATTGTGAGNYTVWVNGVSKGTGAYTSFTAVASTADAGNDGNAGQRTEELTGSVDEIRIMSSTLNTDWVLTEYNNQNSPSTFYSISTEPKTWTGTTSKDFAVSTNWAGGSAPVSGDDILIPNVANQPSLSANFQANAVYMRAGTTLSLSTFTLSLRNDLTSCGTINGASGALALNATSSFQRIQYISGSGTYNLNHLTINNTHTLSPCVILNKDVNVAGDLALTSGTVFTTTTNILALGSGATSTSGSSTSYVDGPMSKTGTTAFVFPVGKGGNWRRCGVSGITSSCTFRAEYFNTSYSSTSPVNSPLIRVSSMEYWQIDKTVGTGSANVSLYWENATGSGISSCPNLTIARYNGSSWDDKSGTTVTGSTCSATGTGTISTSTAFATFSPFTFGSLLYGVNPLPVGISSWGVSCNDGRPQLKWTTETETNSDHFEIEKSNDGGTWESVGTIASAGNSKTKREYSLNDPNANGMTYYRLWEIDRNGQKTIAKIIDVNCSVRVEQIQVIPNPASLPVYMRVSLTSGMQNATVTVLDVMGHACYSQKMNLFSGENDVILNADLMPGVYQVVISSPDHAVKATRFILR